jgi:hypothetical protein
MTLRSSYEAELDGEEPDLTFDGPLPDWVFADATGFPFHTADRVFGGLDQMIQDLLYGKLRAFGDPLRAGAQPEWIPPRLWHHLKLDQNDPYRLSGAGTTYWHVKVGSVTEFFSWAKFDGPAFSEKSVSSSDGSAIEVSALDGPRLRRRATKEEIEALYKQRVAEAIENRDRFNRDDDMIWGKVHGVTDRGRIRDLRRAHAPEDWKKRVATVQRK